MNMKIINYAVGVSLICVCFSGSGCANYIRDISTVTQETDRRIISTKYELKVQGKLTRRSQLIL